MKHQRPLLLASLVIALGALAAAGRGHPPRHRRAFDAQAASASDLRAPRHEARHDALAARRYAVELRTSMTLTSTSTAQRDAIDVSVAGAVELAPLRLDARGAVLALRFVDARVEVTQAQRSALTPATRATLERSLAEPLYVDRAADGSVTGVRAARDLDPMMAGAMRYLVATMQLVRDPSDRGDHRVVDELDAAGPCRAEYRLVGERVWTRARSRSPRHAQGGPRLDGEARARLRLDARGELDAVSSDDTLRTDAGDGITASATSRVSVTLVSTAAALDDATARAHLARWAARDAVALDVTPVNPAGRASRDRRLVAGASLSTLRAALPATADSERDGAASALVRARIAALLRIDPTAADEARRALLSGARPAEVAALVGALAEAGDARCQGALVDVAASSTLSSDQRAQALTSLALVERPTAETVRALDRMADARDVGGPAMLALGAAGGAAREGGAPWADEAFEALVRRLDRATSDDDVTLALDALGNTGDPRLVPLAERAMSNPSATVREAAVAAVRLVRTPEADAFVASRLRARDDVASRVGAIRAAAFRALDPLGDALGALLGDDPVAAVRARAVSMLGPRQREQAMAGELLLRAAGSDPDDDVREAARAWLRQLDGA